MYGKCGSIVKAMERIKEYMRGWLDYYSMADMKNNIEDPNEWLYRKIRMCSWKQWKLPRTRSAIPVRLPAAPRIPPVIV